MLRAIIAASAAATLLYTPVLKRLTLIKNVAVASVIALTPLTGALALGQVPAPRLCRPAWQQNICPWHFRRASAGVHRLLCRQRRPTRHAACVHTVPESRLRHTTGLPSLCILCRHMAGRPINLV